MSTRSERKVVTSEYELHEVMNTNLFLLIRKYPGSKLADCTCPSESVSSTFASIWIELHGGEKPEFECMSKVLMFKSFVYYIAG